MYGCSLICENYLISIEIWNNRVSCNHTSNKTMVGETVGNCSLFDKNKHWNSFEPHQVTNPINKTNLLSDYITVLKNKIPPVFGVFFLHKKNLCLMFNSKQWIELIKYFEEKKITNWKKMHLNIIEYQHLYTFT